MTVIVIIARSESGDDYGPRVFSEQSTQKQLEEFLQATCPDEFPEEQDGPGIFGSYLYISTYEREVQSSEMTVKLGGHD